MDDSHVALSTRLLEEYVGLEQILLGDLRELLEQPLDADTSRWLVVVLDALLEIGPQQFAIKRQGGYLQAVLDAFPDWYPQVAALEEEYFSLYETVAELRARILQTRPLEAVADQVRLGLRRWMEELTQHRCSERALVQTAVNLDVGVGD